VFWVTGVAVAARALLVDPAGRLTTEIVYPLQLAELLPGLLADGWDGRPRLVD